MTSFLLKLYLSNIDEWFCADVTVASLVDFTFQQLCQTLRDVAPQADLTKLKWKDSEGDLISVRNDKVLAVALRKLQRASDGDLVLRIDGVADANYQENCPSARNLFPENCAGSNQASVSAMSEADVESQPSVDVVKDEVKQEITDDYTGSTLSELAVQEDSNSDYLRKRTCVACCDSIIPTEANVACFKCGDVYHLKCTELASRPRQVWHCWECSQEASDDDNESDEASESSTARIAEEDDCRQEQPENAGEGSAPSDEADPNPDNRASSSDVLFPAKAAVGEQSDDVPAEVSFPAWLTTTQPRKSPYFPQIDDIVVYFWQGHALYVDAVRKQQLYDVKESLLPYVKHGNTIETHEFCRVAEIKYDVEPYRLCYLKLAQLSYGRSRGTGRFFELSYHDMDDVADFLVLKHYFDHAMASKWQPNDEFHAIIADKLYTGRIDSFSPLDDTYPTSPFLTVNVTWRDSISDCSSLWDLEVFDNRSDVKLLTEENRKRYLDRDNRTLFVKGFPKSVTVKDMKDLSTDILSIKRPRPDAKFMFLVFASEQVCEQNFAKLSTATLKGKPLVVDYCGPKSKLKPAGTATPKVLGNDGTVNNLELYIGGLPITTTADDLKALFPEAADVVLPRKGKRSKKSSIFAFVAFATPAIARAAFDKNRTLSVQGIPVQVMFARMRERPNVVKQGYASADAAEPRQCSPTELTEFAQVNRMNSAWPEWPLHGRQLETQRLLSGLELCAQRARAEGFEDLLSFELYAGCEAQIEYPCHLTTICERLRAGFYRRINSVLLDVRQIWLNADWFRPRSELAEFAMRVSNALLLFIRNPSCRDINEIFEKTTKQPVSTLSHERACAEELCESALSWKAGAPSANSALSSRRTADGKPDQNANGVTFDEDEDTAAVEVKKRKLAEKDAGGASCSHDSTSANAATLRRRRQPSPILASRPAKRQPRESALTARRSVKACLQRLAEDGDSSESDSNNDIWAA